MRQVVIPTLQAKAAEAFPGLSRNDAYNQLMRDLDWDEEEFGPCFLLAMDKDRRHSFVDYRHYRNERQNTGRGKKRDRRELEYGQGDHIQFQDRQLIPSAQRVPDTIQQPVELCVGWIKRRVRKTLKGVHKLTFEHLRDAVVDACEELNATDHIKSFWDHATKAIAIFAAEEGKKVKVTVKNKEKIFHGTRGGWVQKQARG